MQIVSTGDNLHEISKPIFWGKYKIYQNVVCWNFTQHAKRYKHMLSRIIGGKQ